MRLNRYFKKFTELGYHPQDSEEEKVNKSTLTVLSIPFAIAGIIWGMLYFMHGLIIPGAIPFSYGVLSILSFINFSITKKYKRFRNGQLILILVLPFILQLSLGGFIPSSAVIIWALISPVGALVFFKTKQSVVWFIAYIALVIAAFFINHFVTDYFDWGLSDGFINIVFVLNIIAVSTLIYAIQYYYVSKQTELKDAIEEKSHVLEIQTEKLKEMDETKSRFFANISHEFRTPLTLILGLLKKQSSKAGLSDDLQDIETMQRNANRLLQLINQLLDLSKLESGELQLKVAKDNITGFIKKLIIQFESLAFDKNISFTLNGLKLKQAHQFKGIELYFDHDKIQKTMTNLISNAIKFSDTNSTIAISINSDSNFVNISVTNTGKGIEADKLQNIFDRFYQIDNASTRQYEGSGIGLALVKELIDLHHGFVKVESSANQTRFTVSLPLAENLYTDEEKVNLISNPDPELIITKRPISQEEILQNENDIKENGLDPLEILIVEDNPDLRNYIKEVLNKKYKVIQAVDGLDGLNKAETYIPDLIVSDVMMPNMDGYTLCEQLKTNEKTNHIPVILLTAKASRKNKLTGLNTGADDYLIKPFDEKELMVRIKNLISLRKKLQKKYQLGGWIKAGNKSITSVQQKFIEDIKEIIEKNIDNSDFGVEDLGSEIAMSRSQVHRKLKALTDLSATKFIRHYRLHRAASFLKAHKGNITEIAYQVGFSSQTYFSSCFQELFGRSPSDYIEKNI